jgi:hypothetical protein
MADDIFDSLSVYCTRLRTLGSDIRNIKANTAAMPMLAIIAITPRMMDILGASFTTYAIWKISKPLKTR